MRLKSRPSICGHGSHQQRFGGAGQTGNQAVAADEQADADLFHHFVLADDDALHLPDDLGIDFAETRNPGLQNVRFKLRVCGHESLLFFAFAFFVAADFEQQLLGRLEIRRGFQS